MKHVSVALLCLTILGVNGRCTTALAEDTKASQAKVPAFYNWLGKYKNPASPTGSQSSPQGTSTVPQRKARLEDRQENKPVNPSSSPAEDPALLSNANASAEFAEPLGPGEGLGCFYHRSYYSHLPLFSKSNTYTLPGSLDVAEPYQKPSSGISISPAEASAQPALPR